MRLIPASLILCAAIASAQSGPSEDCHIGTHSCVAHALLAECCGGASGPSGETCAPSLPAGLLDFPGPEELERDLRGVWAALPQRFLDQVGSDLERRIRLHIWTASEYIRAVKDCGTDLGESFADGELAARPSARFCAIHSVQTGGHAPAGGMDVLDDLAGSDAAGTAAEFRRAGIVRGVMNTVRQLDSVYVRFRRDLETGDEIYYVSTNDSGVGFGLLLARRLGYATDQARLRGFWNARPAAARPEGLFDSDKIRKALDALGAAARAARAAGFDRDFVLDAVGADDKTRKLVRQVEVLVELREALRAARKAGADGLVAEVLEAEP